MTMLKKEFLFLFIALFSFVAVAKSDDEIKPNIQVDYKPDLSTDEGGFWYKVNKLEKDVKLSPYRIRDTKLTEYMEDMVCRLAGEYCPNIRVYIINNPGFNASMYPNGMMQIWTGLLLRVDNEAQLAAILGHEISHYLMSHQIQQWRRVRDGSAAAMFLDIGIAALTGVYGVASLTMAGSTLGFSRDHEREADILGLSLMAKAGYQPNEAGKIWDVMVAERAADTSKESTSLFWSTHPPSTERAETLSAKAPDYLKKFPKASVVNQNGYVEKITPLYKKFMQNHIGLQELEQTALLLKKHENIGYDKSMIYYFTGEMHRLGGKKGDMELAIDAYSKSVNETNPPPESYKQLGYLLLKEKRKKESLSAFESYLELLPEATDKAMIEYYLKTLR